MLVLIRQLLSLGTAAAVALPMVSAEPENAVTLSIPATAEHPRNSEGAFVTLRSGRVAYYYSQFSEGASDFSP